MERAYPPLTRRYSGAFIGIISTLCHFVSKPILSQLYYSLVYPSLTCCLIIWGNTYENAMKLIISVQKKAQSIFRIMNFSKYNDHTSPLFEDFNILKFTDIVYYLN